MYYLTNYNLHNLKLDMSLRLIRGYSSKEFIQCNSTLDHKVTPDSRADTVHRCSYYLFWMLKFFWCCFLPTCYIPYTLIKTNFTTKYKQFYMYIKMVKRIYCCDDKTALYNIRYIYYHSVYIILFISWCADRKGRFI